MHGGIGFTWEHDTNVYYRRALMLAACFGRAADYPQQVVDIATTTGMRTIDIDLDPDTEKLRDEIRAEVAALKAIPREERTVAIAEGGWVLPHLPKPWGRASSPVEQIIIAQEFTSRPGQAAARSGIAAWIIPSIVAFGTEEQKQRFLPPTFRGEMIWCQLFSEPGAGSDLAGLTTKATKVDGGWRITGQKIWTTAAQFSQWGALLARTDPSAPKHNGITYFLLDMNSDGVEVKPLRELTGNAMFNTVFIDDVFVPDELVLGEVNRGWEVSRNTLTAERVSIGSSEAPFLANLDQFVEFVRDGHFDQIGQNRAGQLIAEGHAAKVLNMRSTLLTLAGGDPMPSAAISKLLSMRTGQGYAEFAVSSFGTDGAIGDPGQLPGKWARDTCWPAGPPRSTAARRRCSSTSSPSGCWGCPATRRPADQKVHADLTELRIGVDLFTGSRLAPSCPRAGPVGPPGGWPRLSKGGASLSPRFVGSPPAAVNDGASNDALAAEPAVVATPEAPVAPEAAATEAAVAPTPAAVPAAVAPTTVAPTTATASHRGPSHRGRRHRGLRHGHPRPAGRRAWADYSRYRRRRGGVSCGSGTEKHCAGHRACADCAGGDAAGRSE